MMILSGAQILNIFKYFKRTTIFMMNKECNVVLISSLNLCLIEER